MDWTGWVEAWGESAVLALGGLLIGVGFGFFAQRSRFCLRAAVIEFWYGRFGDKPASSSRTTAAGASGNGSAVAAAP